VLHAGKRPGAPVTPDMVLDFAYIVIPIAIIGTRLYYVLSMWENYKDNLLKIFAFREGGLAIHGAIISAIATAYVYARVKKINFLRLTDVCVVGLPIGQALGRWGNFFNQEVFGGHTNSVFAMCYKLSAFGAYDPHVTPDIMANLYRTGGVEYIQVHPTFLYESVWCLLTFVVLMLWFNRRRFNGQILAGYLALYGFGRFWIESIRTDQLKLFNTDIPSAMVVSALMVLVALAFICVNLWRLRHPKEETEYVSPFADENGAPGAAEEITASVEADAEDVVSEEAEEQETVEEAKDEI